MDGNSGWARETLRRNEDKAGLDADQEREDQTSGDARGGPRGGLRRSVDAAELDADREPAVQPRKRRKAAIASSQYTAQLAKVVYGKKPKEKATPQPPVARSDKLPGMSAASDAAMVENELGGESNTPATILKTDGTGADRDADGEDRHVAKKRKKSQETRASTQGAGDLAEVVPGARIDSHGANNASSKQSSLIKSADDALIQPNNSHDATYIDTPDRPPAMEAQVSRAASESPSDSGLSSALPSIASDEPAENFGVASGAVKGSPVVAATAEQALLILPTNDAPAVETQNEQSVDRRGSIASILNHEAAALTADDSPKIVSNAGAHTPKLESQSHGHSTRSLGSEDNAQSAPSRNGDVWPQTEHCATKHDEAKAHQKSEHSTNEDIDNDGVPMPSIPQHGHNTSQLEAAQQAPHGSQPVDVNDHDSPYVISSDSEDENAPAAAPVRAQIETYRHPPDAGLSRFALLGQPDQWLTGDIVTGIVRTITAMRPLSVYTTSDFDRAATDCNKMFIEIIIQPRMDTLLGVLNIGDSHWILVSFDIYHGWLSETALRVDVFDSLAAKDEQTSSRMIEMAEAKLTPFIESVRQAMIRRRGQNVHAGKIIVQVSPQAGPKQDNFWDCGIAVCVAALYRCAGKSIPTKTSYPVWRSFFLYMMTMGRIQGGYGQDEPDEVDDERTGGQTLFRHVRRDIVELMNEPIRNVVSTPRPPLVALPAEGTTVNLPEAALIADHLETYAKGLRARCATALKAKEPYVEIYDTLEDIFRTGKLLQRRQVEEIRALDARRATLWETFGDAMHPEIARLDRFRSAAQEAARKWAFGLEAVEKDIWWVSQALA